MRAILEDAVRPPERLRMGTALAQAGAAAGVTLRDVEVLEQSLAARPAMPMRFE
jgi:hypothetical protein